MCIDNMVSGFQCGLTVLVVCGAAAAPLGAQGARTDGDSVRAILQERIARQGAVGLVAGIVRGEHSVLVAAGRRGVGDAAPVAPDGVFEIGSVAKAITGTLLAEMTLRGEVALDDPIRKFLPASVPVPSRNGREITLLDLATHTSGLPRLPDNFTPADPGNPYADYGVADLYAFLAGHTLTRDPGTVYEYSNLGAGLLGHLLARHAGRSYEALVIERILEPLGMADTRITLTQPLRNRLAAGHSADLEPAPNWEMGVLAGAGAWRSTGQDILRLLRAALVPDERPVGRALALATAPRRPTEVPGLQVGLGWHVQQRAGETVIWHNGQTGGYHAFIGFDRESATGAFVLANAAVDVDDIGRHLVAPAWPVSHPAPPRPTIAVAPATLERYVGEYALAPELVMTITRDGETLYAQVTGQSRFRVFALSPIRFYFRVVEAEIEFTLDADGQVTGLTLFQAGREMTARRI